MIKMKLKYLVLVLFLILFSCAYFDKDYVTGILINLGEHLGSKKYGKAEKLFTNDAFFSFKEEKIDFEDAILNIKEKKV